MAPAPDYLDADKPPRQPPGDEHIRKYSLQPLSQLCHIAWYAFLLVCILSGSIPFKKYHSYAPLPSTKMMLNLEKNPE